MDGVAFFSPAATVTEEWTYFLTANPAIRSIHCPQNAASAIADSGEWLARTGVVLRYEGERGVLPSNSNVCRTPKLPAVYALLAECFDTIQPFDAWYVDVSHRVRHDCCQIACICDGDRVVSTAMTVAETESAAILGQVATAPTHRRQGLAAKCVSDLILRCKADELYILPVNERAQALYVGLGFAPCDNWAELIRN
ncbi:MAG: GNAT family N-acetyltransferase [Clostridia bacterium]|nr:GNAT family N-acetyltransferase [Clostridia bacterium]